MNNEMITMKSADYDLLGTAMLLFVFCLILTFSLVDYAMWGAAAYTTKHIATGAAIGIILSVVYPWIVQKFLSMCADGADARKTTQVKQICNAVQYTAYALMVDVVVALLIRIF